MEFKLTRIHPRVWGGLSSMCGSAVIAFSGDPQGFGSMCAFFASEAIFIAKGKTSWGYSLGCLGIAVGDGLLPFSHATMGNPLLQYAMSSLSVSWLIGAMRHPLGVTASKTRRRFRGVSKRLFGITRRIPPVVGATTLLHRIPVIASAALAGHHVNIVPLVANGLWGTSDIMLGRVNDHIVRPARIVIAAIRDPKSFGF